MKEIVPQDPASGALNAVAVGDEDGLQFDADADSNADGETDVGADAHLDDDVKTETDRSCFLGMFCFEATGSSNPGTSSSQAGLFEGWWQAFTGLFAEAEAGSWRLTS